MACDEQDGVPEGGLTDAAHDALRGIAAADLLKLKAEQRESERQALLDDVRLCVEVANTTAAPVVGSVTGRKVPVIMPADLLRHLTALRNGVVRANENAKRDALVNQLAHLVAHYLTGSKCDGGDDPETDQRDGFTVPKGIDPQ